ASLDSLIDHVNTRLVAQKTEAAREVRIRAAAAAVVDEPIYYVVKRGDALSTISKRFDTTPEQIREWNNLPGDRVRIGQQLTVKPKGRRQEPIAAPAVAPPRAPAR
ncbi:MAG: LysM peptidoglycan-binding domain-containing protein, partial [Gemmatimonadota bacterium]|nr:LysM peptidoglycan-binding domain-containing protein [Gemmatimonadota bacterium]